MDKTLLTGYPVSPEQATLPSPSATLEGERVVLMPFNLDRDARALYTLFATSDNSDNWVYLPYGPFASEKEFVSWCQSTCTANDPFFYTIFDLNNRPLGLSSFLRIDAVNRVIEVGHIHYSKILQGTAMGTEAQYLLMKYAFEQLGYRRYEWKCDALNNASRRAALRLGFSYEGTFRQHLVYKSRNRDTSWFSLLDNEWSNNKAVLESWLDTQNFDKSGLQLRSLASIRQNSG